MSDTPTLTVYEKCKHNRLVRHEVMLKTDDGIRGEACPGGREIVFRISTVSELYENEGLGATEAFVKISEGS